MTGFPGAPRLTKGALVSLDPLTLRASVVAFQFNPDGVTRNLAPQGAQDAGGRADPVRYTGAPVETIQIELVLDASDDMASGAQPGASDGVAPRLAALELLVYPDASAVSAAAALSLAGVIEVLPAQAPFTLFSWGQGRLLPVRLDSMAITEVQHGPALDPLHAKVSLQLRVLSYSDLPPLHPGYSIYLAHQLAKERLAARAGGGAGLGSLLGT